jgi:hypothetical protein
MANYVAKIMARKNPRNRCGAAIARIAAMAEGAPLTALLVKGAES